MIKVDAINAAYNRANNRRFNDMVIDYTEGYYPLQFRVQQWLESIGFNWPMTEEQEVIFKLTYL